MQIFKRLYIILFILVCYQLAQSQNYNFKHYTVEDGLPSSEVYSTFQDSKGYIWFATDAGVSRFDGYKFKNFDVKDGLTDNTVFLFSEDNKGQIWFGTFNNKLCYFYNDKIIEFEHNDKIADFLNEKNQPLASFEIDSNGTIWMGFLQKGLISCTVNGVIKMADYNQENEVSHTIFIHKLTNNKVVFGGKPTETLVDFVLANKVRPKIEFFIKKDNEKKKRITEWLHEMNKINNINLVSGKKDLVFINENLFIVNEGRDEVKRIEIKELKNNRLFSCFYEENKLWLCIENNGIIVYDLYNDELRYNQTLLENINVARVYKDRNNAYWFTTLNHGVYYLKSLEFKYYPFQEQSIISMDIDTLMGNVFIGLDDNRILMGNLLTSNKRDFTTIHNCRLKPEEIKFNYLNSSLIIGSEGYALEILNNKIKNQEIKRLFPISAKSIIFDSNETYLGHTYGISKRVNNKEVYDSYLETKKKYWCSSVLKQDSFIWMGTNEGLIQFNNNTHKIITPFKYHKILSTSITSLANFEKDIILIGTKSYGLILFKNNKIIKVFDNITGLESNLIKSIYVDNNRDIWVGTNKGLNKIGYKSEFEYEIRHITTNHGLISNEINQIQSFKNNIYLSTPKGLIEFDKTKFSVNKLSSPIYISGFKVNSKNVEFDIELSHPLLYFQNNIEISYVCLNYKSLGKIEYSYRLLGIDTNWLSTNQTNVTFYSLPDGDYTFEVIAKNEDGYWSSPVEFVFKIKPPFWFTWWFIGLEILFTIISIIIIFKYRENQLLKKNDIVRKITENEKKIIELELKALRSQMNPHFIFNTLNSIQMYISRHDFKESNRYISNFSRLIRMVLNHSEKPFINLRDELEMLTLYIGLEQIRFENQFDYYIKVDEELDLDCDKIPPMLLQPFIENAIWHGLMKKSEKGKIEVDLKLSNDILYCSIQDNGIGRAAALKIKAERKIQNKSIGMRVTKDRLSIMYNEKYNNMDVEIVDLHDENNNPTGTKIIIKIPLK